MQLKFLEALADDFDKHGVDAIKSAREQDPVGYIKAVAGLMPKQFEQLSPLEELSDGELCAAIDYIVARLAGEPAEGATATH